MLFFSFKYSYCYLPIFIKVFLKSCLQWYFLKIVIKITPYDSPSLRFFMMYSVYKLNKQGDNIQLWCAPFPVITTVVLCKVLTVSSWPTYSFLRRQIRWSGILISLRIFHNMLWFTQSGSAGAESACNVGEQGLIPGSGGSPGEWNGNPLQYSCLENSMDRGAWWPAVSEVTRVRYHLATKTFTFTFCAKAFLWPMKQK